MQGRRVSGRAGRGWAWLGLAGPGCRAGVAAVISQAADGGFAKWSARGGRGVRTRVVGAGQCDARGGLTGTADCVSGRTIIYSGSTDCRPRIIRAMP